MDPTTTPEPIIILDDTERGIKRSYYEITDDGVTEYYAPVMTQEEIAELSEIMDFHGISPYLECTEADEIHPFKRTHYFSFKQDSTKSTEWLRNQLSKPELKIEDLPTIAHQWRVNQMEHPPLPALNQIVLNLVLLQILHAHVDNRPWNTPSSDNLEDNGWPMETILSLISWDMFMFFVTTQGEHCIRAQRLPCLQTKYMYKPEVSPYRLRIKLSK